MIKNETAIVKVEEHRNEKVVCFTVDCIDPENEAWGKMSEWCKQNVPDRTARRYVGVALSGHHPQGEEHQNASEHIEHPYKAMIRILMDLQKFCMRRITLCSNGLRSSFPRDHVHVPITGEFILAASQGASAGCPTVRRS